MISGLVQWVNRASSHKNFYWLASLLITALGALFRFIDLATPSTLVFDETYYVKDAYTLGQFGHEKQWPDDANLSFEAGQPDVFLDEGSYVVHPPVGKWLIWFGIQLFGVTDSFGWRFSTALLGTLAIPLLIAVANRLIGNRVFALMAGLFLAIEGHAVVLSRTAILDGMLAFFVLMAFYFFVRDQQSWQHRVTQLALGARGWLIAPRPWLLLSAISLGLASGVKWSGIYFLAAFGLWSFVADLGQRQRLGVKVWPAFAQASVNAVTMIAAGLATYVASWSGWILSEGGWGRSAEPDWLSALWAYHQNAYSFHTGLNSEHPYQANALQWLISGRPTAFYYESFEGEPCGVLDSCSIAITAMPNPLIWWGGVLAVFWLMLHFLRRFELGAGMIAVGFLAGWAPWLAYLGRTTFQFYAVVISPFLVLALVYALHRFWRVGITQFRRPQRERAIAIFVLVALGLALFFATLWMGIPVPYWWWRIQMWFPFWI
ncbi:phospholipid carrier-dependent glycosyltransferase [Aquiluna borgnonia]|uniref:Polyprenol-phosphate-mannose--protein mannosyltransferase n=1 Tax=Aquiluna borgnonia TaxID=2499157 RepID=A0A7D4UI10_9MICO|nr:phospholipid carrier-dependent glycosyltransferase [Aquiluna borgnonia]QKJ24960.1 phospholipid carrier-dependent glycosyltransferase [Aquiluna borgnonia]